MIHPSQSGFRKGRSCTDNLVTLLTSIKIARNRCKDTLGAFLDVQSAFDNINCTLLIQKLAETDSSPNIIKFNKRLTFDGNISAVRGTEDYDARATWKGLPQGGVLSPLLYDFYVAVGCS